MDYREEVFGVREQASGQFGTIADFTWLYIEEDWDESHDCSSAPRRRGIRPKDVSVQNAYRYCEH
jgi:hypothetical protein